MFYDNSELTMGLEVRAAELEKLIDELQARVVGAPVGKLRIATRDGRIEYYHRKNKTDRCGKYIKVNNHNLPKQLAQKDYDFDLLTAAINELEAIRKLQDANMISHINDKTKLMSSDKLKLITSVEDLRREFIEKWSVVNYEHRVFKPDDPEYYSSDGTRVCSKSEGIILDTYQRHNIPFHYEKPLIIDGYVFHPDFYLLNTRTMKSFYHEHLGMMGNQDYAYRTIRKLKLFENNGIILGKNLLITMEANGIPVTYKDIENIIREYLT